MRTKIITAATLLAAGLGAVTLASGSASARDRFALSIDTGNFRAGYSNGYYDYWRGDRYRRRPMSYAAYWDRGDYYPRYRDRAWRDSDGDGVPNRYDRFPRDPWND